MEKKQLSKGGALIKARDLLGPSASVFQDGPMFYIGVGDVPASNPNFTVPVVGHSWEQALKLAEDSDAAKQWHNEQVAIGNKIGAAKQSLAKTTLELAMKKYQDFMKHMAAEIEAKQIAKEESAHEYEEWKKKREARFAR